jgi:sulfite reductase (NADPH) flavoprotein alpha-component
MIISFWRYSHLALAVSSFLLLTLAALTGIVLAFEPVTNKAQGYKVDGFDTLTLSHVVPVLKEKLHGLQELKVDENDFVVAKYTNERDNDTTVFIHPLTAELLGTPQKQKPLFEWATSLHRSLFLHETGRAIVGVTAFLLILIALSGVALIIQRQNGIRRFFAPIEKASFAQYYHTFFGRLSLIFILAIALSGSYLSASRFFIKPQKVSAKVNEDDIKEEPERALRDFPVFRQTKLADVETIQFPFSDFPEDYYTLRLKNGELCVNQITGDVLAQTVYPKSYSLAAFSLRWHTGRSSSVWAILLAITSGYILFFIYSGFVITWRRIRSKSKNRFKAQDCRTIILVGSENGSTYRFASAVYHQLLKHGEKVFLADMSTYTVYPRAEQLLLLTSTYGEGDAPSNATHFLERLQSTLQQQPIRFSVLGFGSRSYKHFCGYADEVDRTLRQQSWATPLLDVMHVNDKSPQDFSAWLTAYAHQLALPLLMPRELLTANTEGLEKMEVASRTEKDGDDAFLVRLKVKNHHKVASGDLLAIYPKNDHRERLYSIGKVNDTIQLSVKLHHHGLGSQYLHGLQTGAVIKAKIVKNQHFHFPQKAAQVIMISNGTGIAPFLGMLDANRKAVPCTLYCGFRTQESFALYQSFLASQQAAKQLTHYQLALSREGDKTYVSHLLQRDEDKIWQALSNGAVLMLCGSLAMQKDVLAVLNGICQKNSGSSIETYQQEGKILTDCY